MAEAGAKAAVAALKDATLIKSKKADWRLVAAAQMLVYTYPHPGGRLGIPPIRFLIPADSVGAVVGAGGLGLREINAALAESGASVQVEPQPLLALQQWARL